MRFSYTSIGFSDDSVGEDLPAVGAHDQLLVDLLKRAKAEDQAIARIARVERSIWRCLHHRSDLLVREKQLLPAIGGVGREGRGVALIQETAGLVLIILTVAVGQEVLPDAPFPRESPVKELLPRDLLVQRPVAVTEIGIVPVAPGEIVQRSFDEIASVPAVCVVPVESLVVPSLPVGQGWLGAA